MPIYLALHYMHPSIALYSEAYSAKEFTKFLSFVIKDTPFRMALAAILESFSLSQATSSSKMLATNGPRKSGHTPQRSYSSSSW